MLKLLWDTKPSSETHSVVKNYIYDNIKFLVKEENINSINEKTI